MLRFSSGIESVSKSAKVLSLKNCCLARLEPSAILCLIDLVKSSSSSISLCSSALRSLMMLEVSNSITFSASVAGTSSCPSSGISGAVVLLPSKKSKPSG